MSLRSLKVSLEVYGYDYPYLEAIDIQSNYPDNWDEATFRKHHDRTRIARTIEHAIGFVVFRHTDKSMLVQRVGTFPKYRRQGVGTRMFRYLIDEAHDMQLEKLSIVIPESNMGACKFLQALEFRATSVLPKHFGEQDGYHFQRKI